MTMTRILLTALAAFSLTACGQFRYASEYSLDTRIGASSSAQEDSFTQWAPSEAVSGPKVAMSGPIYPVQRQAVFPGYSHCVRVEGVGCVSRDGSVRP